MTHKLIKADNYLLVVDNSDPNKGDYTYNIDNGLISISDKVLSLSEMLSRKKIKKVLAHLPLNGSPILEGVDLLPAYAEPNVDLIADWAMDYIEVNNKTLHQYPTEFECEVKQRFEADKSKRENPLNGVYYEPKTTTINGRRTWVGKYK